MGILNPIIAKGVKGNGSFVWHTLDMPVGPVNVGSIYAPNERAKRMELWNRISSTLHEGNWLIADDWNMVDLFDDSVGASPCIHDSEEHR